MRLEHHLGATSGNTGRDTVFTKTVNSIFGAIDRGGGDPVACRIDEIPDHATKCDIQLNNP